MWFLVQTIKGRENIAYVNLLRQHYSAYLPVAKADKRWQELDYEPLFPSYLFVFMTLGSDDFHPIRKTQGVSRLVQFGTTPAVVPTSIIDNLRKMENESGIHDIGKVDYERGDRVRILTGPFAGMMAEFWRRTPKERIILLLDVLGKSTEIEMSFRQVEPITG